MKNIYSFNVNGVDSSIDSFGVSYNDSSTNFGVTNVQDAIEKNNVISYIHLIPNAPYGDGTYINRLGFVDSTSSGWKASDYIYISSGETLYMYPYFQYAAFYNSNKFLVEIFGNTTPVNSYTASEDGYIRTTLKEPIDVYYCYKQNILFDIINNTKQIVSLKEQHTLLELKTNNIIDNDYNNIINTINLSFKGYVGLDGQYHEHLNNTFRSSDYIEIVDTDKEKLFYIKTWGNSNIAPLCIYDEDMNCIQIVGKNLGDDIDERQVFEFVFGNSAKYYRLSFTYSVSYNYPYEFGNVNSYVNNIYTKTEIDNKLYNTINYINIYDNYTNTYIVLNGSTYEHNSWMTSDYINIEDEIIYYAYQDSSYTNIGFPYYYDESKNYLGFQKITTESNFLKLSPPSNAKYIKISKIKNGNAGLIEYKKSKIFDADAIIIPIFGQSNALGWNATPAISILNKYDNLLDKDFNILSENTIAASSYGICETSASGTGEYIINKLKTKNIICIPVSGLGGNPITSFIKDTTGYNTVITQIKTLYNYFKISGKESIKVPCYCYIQGEGEVLTDTDYKSLLSQMQQDFSDDVQSITGQTESVKCCVYNLSWISDPTSITFDSSNMRVCTAQMELVRDNENFIASAPTYCCGYNPSDKIHLSNVGERLLGMYQGISIAKLINGERHLGVLPLSYEVSDNIITININVPSPPLKINTTLLSSVSNYGFSVINLSNVDIISSVEILDDTLGVIIINCSESPIGCKLRYGCNGTTYSGFNDGPRGNISDSNGLKEVTEILGTIYKLDNYMQSFEIIL